ncbi:MAG: DUF4433 domain-containing protein [Chloroflexi bacterium]|nr:DUF4433 domain-containing protein [Chloroflexota bacterium]
MTQIDNLRSIIGLNGLLCDGNLTNRGLTFTDIAHAHIKARRSQKAVPIGAGGTLCDYVPFYFAPRSPMLFAIHKDAVVGYNRGQEGILHLVTSVEDVVRGGLPFVFTDGHAAMAISQFFADLSSLDRVDWPLMDATYWNDTYQDGDRKRRRSAEFLVHQFVPWSLFSEIGVMNSRMALQVGTILASSLHRPAAVVRRGWCY